MKPPKTPPKKTSGWLALLDRIGALPGLLLHGRVRGLTAMFALVAILGGAWYALWRSVRDDVVASPEYQVSQNDVELTPRPGWIRTDLVEEVFRQTNLGGGALSVLDDDLCERLAGAFALHPWIAKIERVAKSFPAHVQIDVVYRRPVCMVEVPAGPDEVADDQGSDDSNRAAQSGGLYPIDRDGVLLPTADFSRVEARNYPRLSDIRTLPLGPVGTVWGDPRVSGAAEIAVTLFDDWQKLHLYRIVPSEHPEPGASSDEFSYNLFTRDGTRILWGRKPTTTLSGEVSAAVKHDRLRKHLSTSAPHEPTAPQQAVELDIRYERGVSATPLTAREPDAASTQ